MINNLRKIRLSCGYDLRTLGRAANINYVSLIRLENNHNWNPTLSTLLKLSKVLEVPVKVLIGEETINQRGRKRMKEDERENQERLNKALKVAKAALEEWKKKFVDKEIRPLVWGYDYEEIKQMIKLLQLKLYNQTG